MFFAQQRREVAELAARARFDRQRVKRAKLRLAAARQGFLGNPLNLLLPFTAGVLGGALALYRKPPLADADDGGRGGAREGVSLRSLISTAGMLWSATATLRESLRAARFEPPAAPATPSGPAGSDVGMPLSAAIDDGDGNTGPARPV